MLRVLVGIANEPSAPPAARVAAARDVIDRGHGKPLQDGTLEHTGALIVRWEE